MSIQKTGIPELDRLMEHGDLLAEDPMVIDKAQFDNIILPLLTNSVNLPADEVFGHLKNIWINYYKASAANRTLTYKDKPEKPIGLHGNGVFACMKIVDTDGNQVGLTPPLIEPSLVVGVNNVTEEYALEVKSNPDLAKVKLINSIKAYKIGNNNKWVAFLDTYGRDYIEASKENDDSPSYLHLADNGIMED